ncbi:MAG TPA: 1-acyl-sn-glycerol-3-phosphate acyltransferase [Candidatus Elarobacter sp.]|nr:1-acyl-sn-glycerol-3-phosphate acyltransferase [Candidatus Elarobacter sp.]
MSGGYPPAGMLGPRAIAWWSLRTMTDGVTVEGLEHVSRTGPVLLAARHYHHLLDGAVLVHHLARPVHIVVGLDWTANARQRRWMERACAWARYPVILRPATTGELGGYAASEVRRYLRSGVRDAAALLRDGRVVLVFPEGYPVVDPTASDATPRTRDADGLLPFAAGFRTIVDAARRGGARDVSVVPVGFRYEPRGGRWRITVRVGAPLAADAGVATVSDAVRELSR